MMTTMKRTITLTKNEKLDDTRGVRQAGGPILWLRSDDIDDRNEKIMKNLTTQGGVAERWLVRSADKCDIVADVDYGTDPFNSR